MPHPRSGNASLRRDATQRGAGSSRLETFFSLRAVQAELRARLRRPTLDPASRYRDLVVFTRLLELERTHLAGRTIRSSAGSEAVPDGLDSDDLTGDSDPEWSHPWGTAASLELHTSLRRHSARRERLGRLLTLAARARATAAADQRYDLIALSVPWRAPEGSPLAPRGSGAPPAPSDSATGGAGSSRLETFFSLRAVQAELRARLRRPTLDPASRYRDLVVFTRLLELERTHLAGRTIRSSAGSEAVPDGLDSDDLTGDSDPEWSHPWGTAASLELHTSLRRHSARRERLGRLLTLAARARATAAADQRYDLIALSVPWRAPEGTRQTVPPKTAAPPAKRGTRPSYALVAVGAVAAFALVASLLASDRQGPDPAPGPSLRAAAVPPFERLDPVPVESPSATQEARRARDRPPARHKPGGADGVSRPEAEAAPEPVPTETAVPASAPAPAPVPASTPAAPAPTPAPEPSPPASEDPPEFGFEQ